MAKLKVHDDIHSIQGILFDKDGTLIELHSLWSAWFEMVCDEVDHQQPNVLYSKKELSDAVGLDLSKKRISHRGPLAIGTMQDIAIIMAFHLYQKKVPWNEAVQVIRNSIAEVHENINWKKLLQPLQGLEAFLINASESGVKMGVVTSDDTDIAEEHLDLMNIHHFFHSIMGSDQIELPKPFPQIGKKVCKEMNVNPNEVIVIGDTNGDMNLGKNLNAIASIGIVTDLDENADHLTDADYVINHYNQLSIT